MFSNVSMNLVIDLSMDIYSPTYFVDPSQGAACATTSCAQHFVVKPIQGISVMRFPRKKPLQPLISRGSKNLYFPFFQGVSGFSKVFFRGVACPLTLQSGVHYQPCIFRGSPGFFFQGVVFQGVALALTP